VANKSVLVAIPCKPEMHPDLKTSMHRFANAMVNNNPGYNVEICVFPDKVEKTPGEISIFDRPAKARNLLIQKHLKDHHDYVFWVDSDLMWYTSDTILRLAAINPDGVTAPLVLIENTGAKQDNWFYDVAAFVEKGQPVYKEGPHFGNVAHAPPYFKSTDDVVDCLSVGCCYLIPASVHRTGVEFYPTPFTDHFPVITKAREMGMRICVARHVLSYHAYLPKYKEAWHSEPMHRWVDFDFDKYGLTVTAGIRPDAGPEAPPPRPAKARTFKPISQVRRG